MNSWRARCVGIRTSGSERTGETDQLDLLEAQGARCEVRLVNPSGPECENRRVKNDYRDCKDLITRMRLKKLPEAWIAPPVSRELRELVRYRAKLVAIRMSFKAQLKAVLGKLESIRRLTITTNRWARSSSMGSA